MYRHVLLLPLVAALSGCVSFFPSYDQAVGQKFSEGFDEVSLLVANAELGEYERRSSYDAAAPHYASAIASVEAARALASATPAPGPAGQAGSAVDEMMANCVTAVTEMAEVHRSSGIPPGAGFISVRTTCAAPYNLFN